MKALPEVLCFAIFKACCTGIKIIHCKNSRLNQPISDYHSCRYTALFEANFTIGKAFGASIAKD